VDREEMARRMAPWKFSGTPQEFKAALLERLQKRAVEFGVDASSYRNEIDEIMNIVATCTALTQTDFSRAYAIRNPRLRLEALNDCDGSAKDVSVWGTRLSPKGTRGIGVSRSVSTYDPKRQDFVMANKFNIVVKFLPVQPEDRTARPMHLIEDIGPTYDIISASIPFSNAGSP
jgi:hypothetical protein